MENERRFRVSITRPADLVIERVARLAVDSGRRLELAHTLREIVELLESQPLEWGDPERPTRLPGGLVCHGIRKPFLVRYAVFESQRIVILFHVQVVDRSYLATDDDE